MCQGILDRATGTLAVVESGVADGSATPTTVHAFGGGEALSQLRDLLGRLPRGSSATSPSKLCPRAALPPIEMPAPSWSDRTSRS